MSALKDRTAIITGASKGLGFAIAERFAATGCRLLITGRNEANLKRAAEKLSTLTETISVGGDVANEAHVTKVFERARKAWSGLDLLVNNAAAFDGGPLDELSLEAWDRVIATNLRGPFLFTRAALGWMKTQNKGRIINIGSIASMRVRPQSAPYATSKHGLWGLTQVTALEGREYGVTCGCIQPGNIQVERRDTTEVVDQEPMMQPSSIAEVALCMASLPPHVEMLEATVLPHQQQYVGRG